MTVDFPAMQLGSPFGSNYFHWLFEVLGRFLLIREFIPPGVRLAVQSGLRGFQTETLAACGVAEEAVFQLPPSTMVQFTQLYVPPKTVTRGLAIQPMALHALRALATPEAGAPVRLYVEREPHARRRIVNDDEVFATLTRHGFTRVIPGELTVREQIALFGRPEAIVGAHGAGLTNALFSPPGTLLVDLQSTELNKQQAAFWNMAAIADQRFIRVICKPITSDETHSDFEVDCSHLDDVLNRRLDS